MTPQLKQKIFLIWHYAGLIVAAFALAVSQCQQLISQTGIVVPPQLLSYLLAASALSATATSIMQHIANNKLAQAIINDPASPAPQGIGLPVPTTDIASLAPALTSQGAALVGASALAVNAAATIAAVQAAAPVVPVTKS